MKRFFKNYLIEGLLMIALGIALLVWPYETNTVLITVIGVLFALVGVLRIAISAAYIGGKKCIPDVVIGLLQIAAGVLLIAKPGMFVNLFPFVIGAILCYGALALFIRSVVARHGIMRILGIVFALLLGGFAVMIMAFPEVFGDYIARLHGIALIIEGVIIVIFMSKAVRYSR